MSLTPREKSLAPLNLSFPIPAEPAFRLDLTVERQFPLLILAGLSALYSAYGAGTPLGATTPTTADVGNTTGQVLAANTHRKWACITNIGEVDAFLNLGSAAEANKGIYLKALGGSFIIDRNNLFLGAVHAITPTSSTTLSIAEA